MSAKSTIQPASEPPPPLVPREWRLRLDPLLLLATLGLVAASLISLKGATQNDIPGSPNFYVYRQAIYAAIGLVLMYVVSRLDYSRLRELRYPLYGLMLALLATVLAIATATLGTKAWIPLPVLQLPTLRARQGPARAHALGLRGRPLLRSMGRHTTAPHHAARAGADDARDRGAGPRLGARLRRRHARGGCSWPERRGVTSRRSPRCSAVRHLCSASPRPPWASRCSSPTRWTASLRF
jgi:hypothetical protein